MSRTIFLKSQGFFTSAEENICFPSHHQILEASGPLLCEAKVGSVGAAPTALPGIPVCAPVASTTLLSGADTKNLVSVSREL